MSKPVIAVDIDDVLFPFVPEIARYHNRLKGTTLTHDDFFSYRFTEVWGGNEAETTQLVEAFLNQDAVSLQPVAGAQQALHQLSKQFDVILVTARNQLFEQRTTEWLVRHFPNLFNQVIFAGNHHDGRGYRPKGAICQEVNASMLIDDSPQNIISALECGVSCILFGEGKWSHAVELPNQVTRCKDWAAVLEYFDGRAG